MPLTVIDPTGIANTGSFTFGNVTSNNVTANTFIGDGSQLSNVVDTVARDTANAAFQTANSGTGAASAGSYANSAFESANSAGLYANSAYGQANTNNGAVERFLFRQTNNNIYGAVVCDILDYANSSKYKTVRNIGGFDTNATSGVVGDVYINSFVWMNTNAINSITLGASGESFKQYSRFSLYGIKG